jgi:hypothetical protein
VYYAADVRLLFASDEGGESGVLAVRVPSTQQPPSTAIQSMTNACRSSSGSSQAGSVHSRVRSLWTTRVPWQWSRKWSKSRPQSGQLLIGPCYQFSPSEGGIECGCVARQCGVNCAFSAGPPHG